MDSTVQLVRNTLCCVKDLDLFADTLLYDPSVISMPEPLHETTPLQALIGVTQFYAFVSISIQGIKLLSTFSRTGRNALDSKATNKNSIGAGYMGAR